jgi:hypothetical protein
MEEIRHHRRVEISHFKCIPPGGRDGVSAAKPRGGEALRGEERQSGLDSLITG